MYLILDFKQDSMLGNEAFNDDVGTAISSGGWILWSKVFVKYYQRNQSFKKGFICFFWRYGAFNKTFLHWLCNCQIHRFSLSLLSKWTMASTIKSFILELKNYTENCIIWYKVYHLCTNNTQFSVINDSSF